MATYSSLFAVKSAGVLISEIDLTTRAEVAASTSAAVVFSSKRGTLDPFFSSSPARFIQMYGEADPQISFGHDCALAFLSRGNRLWGQRVVNGALHAGMIYFADRYSALGSTTTPRAVAAPFPAGTASGFKAGARDVTVLAVSAQFVASNTNIGITMTDGATVSATATVTFATDHNTTMASLVAAIQTTLSTFGTGAQVVLVNETSSVNAPRYLILIYSPVNKVMSYSITGAVTGGVSQPTLTIDSSAVIMTLFAENPGEWGNNLGVRVTNVDVGRRQRFAFTFSGPLVASNVVAITIDNVTVSTTYATSSDATLAALATALSSHPSLESATVTSVPGALNNDRVITAIAKVAGPNAVVLNSAVVTLGVSQAAIVMQETLTGMNATNEFNLEIYDTSVSVVQPVHKPRVTLKAYVNAAGTQTAIDRRLNSFDNGSYHLRVVPGPAAATFKFTPHLQGGVGPAYNVDDTLRMLSGGNDGAAVFNSQIAAAWTTVFTNRDKYQTNLLINAGYTDPSVQQAMVALAEYRHDAIAILDMPSDQQLPQSAYYYRTQVLNIDSSFGAIYSPDLGVQDDNSDEIRFIPPSGHVAAQYAFNDMKSAVFYAPAGLNRGVLQKVRKLRHEYELGDRELLDPVNVNCIINKKSTGPTIWGENTLQVRKSILSAVHSRRLLNALVSAYADALDYSVFEPNNPFTRYNVEQIGYTVVNPILRAGGLLDAKVLCNSDNNPPDQIDAEQLVVDVYLKITPTAKQILLRAVLARTGASFSELVKVVNNTSAAA